MGTALWNGNWGVCLCGPLVFEEVRELGLELELTALRELNVPFKPGGQGPKQEGERGAPRGAESPALKKPTGAEWPRGP